MTTWICTTPDKPWQDHSGSLANAADSDSNLQLTDTRDQTILGFGGCFNELGWEALSWLDPDQRDQIIRDLFDPEDGCRFSFCRVPIGASDYAVSWYSHNETEGDLDMNAFNIDRDHQYLIPYIKAAIAQQPDLRLFASPWSPPTWMKQPKAYNYGTLVWNEQNLKAYALYLLKFVQAYQQLGLDVRQVHVQNEPNSDQKFPSCLWKPEQFAEFIGDYLGPLFERENNPCEIWAGTIERPGYDTWPNRILSDAKAQRYVAGLGFQWAGKGAVQTTHLAWPDVPIIQTENECGDGQNTWDYARYVFSLIHHYMINGTCAYTYWNMVLPAGGRSTWGWLQNSMITVDPETRAVTYQPEFYVMKHLTRFIDNGATRRGLAGPLAGNALAFENPGGSTTLLIANPSDNPRTLAVDINGQSLSATLPAQSFNTIVA
ncbi:glycoside hydrolase family 30 protein [Mucisphaera calidilacus]|uniref:O-Glycosyl hydrolase family 30 n=1 Tax=Mucisphaera calidilacus TaxID=2527982 RepID=A0A518BUB7_9BACT|nr:glycoside hydrolase family 30 protein [Mucisphaera calidilacus]QDU70556.1 O-Glycosyl hydrolase family 30 [Mucisphaera calidilacus]